MTPYEKLHYMATQTRRRKLGNNTYLEVEPDGYWVTLHGHRILWWSLDGTKCRMWSWGRRTPTPKSRLNEWGPPGVRIYQDNYQWFYRFIGPGNAGMGAFIEGMMFSGNGTKAWPQPPEAPC